MAIIIEAITVVVRRSAIRQAFNGNESAFEALAPNRTGRKDEHLYAIGFLNDFDAEVFITRVLEAHGLIWTRGDEAVDITIIDQLTGLHHYTPWLKVDQLPVKGGEVTAAWLGGTQPGKLKARRGWNYEAYSGLTRTPMEGRPKGQPSGSETPEPAAVIDARTREEGCTANDADSVTPAPSSIVQEHLRKFYDDLERIWGFAREVIKAKFRAKGIGETLDLKKQDAKLELILGATRAIARREAINEPRVHFTEGYLLTALERPREAEIAFRRAYVLAPDAPSIVGELIATLSELGKIDEAIEIGRRAMPQHANDPAIPVNLAFLLHSAGQDDEAIDVLQTLLAGQPDHSHAKQMMTQIKGSGKAVRPLK